VEREKNRTQISGLFISDRHVEIRVTDTGVGIPADIQSKVFDPFFTTKAVGKGTGQGLAIAYDVIAGKHNGTLTFETEPDSGTTFIIRLQTARDNSTFGDTSFEGDDK
jgi:signal transduction histidine kinase